MNDAVVSELARVQKGVLALMKRREWQTDDPYLRAVAGSTGLRMLRKIALWWTMVSLEAQCRYTTRLLKRLGEFDAAVAGFFENEAVSPFIEEMGPDFLRRIMARHEPLLCSVAEFELSILLIQLGRGAAREIVWDRHPERAIVALERQEALPEPEPGWLYRLRIDPGERPTMRCEREAIVGLVVA